MNSNLEALAHYASLLGSSRTSELDHILTESALAAVALLTGLALLAACATTAWTCRHCHPRAATLTQHTGQPLGYPTVTHRQTLHHVHVALKALQT